jgi:hypothetical protein
LNQTHKTEDEVPASFSDFIPDPTRIAFATPNQKPPSSKELGGFKTLHMNWHTFCAVRRFHQHLGKRRVRMDVARDLVRCQLHHVRERQFGQ